MVEVHEANGIQSRFSQDISLVLNGDIYSVTANPRSPMVPFHEKESESWVTVYDPIGLKKRSCRTIPYHLSNKTYFTTGNKLGDQVVWF